MRHRDADNVFCRGGAHFVKYLIEEPAFDGLSPFDLHKWFMTAYDWQNAEIISMLLPRVLDCIQAGDFPECVFLDDSASDINQSILNLRQGRHQVLEMLLRYKEFQGHWAEFFLHSICIAAFADDKSLRLVLSLGVPVDCRYGEAEGDFQTGLHMATFMNHTTLVQVLSEAGANVNGEDENGRIPLDYASINYGIHASLDPSLIIELLFIYGSKTGQTKLAGSKSDILAVVKEKWRSRSEKQG